MRLKKIYLVLVLIYCLFPLNSLAQNSNVGFIPSNIWYSKDPFEEGDKIKIYSVVFNPDSRELSGTVIFFDQSVLLGTKKFVVEAKSITDVSIDWTATVGDHTIFAKIENAKFLISPNKYEEIYLVDNKTEESKRHVAKKIILADQTKTEERKNDTENNPISNINNFVQEKTPPIVTKTIDTTVNTLEGARQNLANTVTENKEKVTKEIKQMGNSQAEKISPDEKNNGLKKEQIQKPLKYVQLFFLSVFSFILKNKVIFYGLLIILIFFILRYLWRLIF